MKKSPNITTLVVIGPRGRDRRADGIVRDERGRGRSGNLQFQ